MNEQNSLISLSVAIYLMLTVRATRNQLRAVGLVNKSLKGYVKSPQNYIPFFHSNEILSSCVSITEIAIMKVKW